MDLEREKIVAYGLGIILFIVGIVSYAAFAEKKSERPIRVMLYNAAGYTLYDMKEHSSEDGYEIECVDCHHEYDEPSGVQPIPCGSEDCHQVEASEEARKRLDAFHDGCIICHEDDGTAPVECAKCHALS